jgi:hypothetical protein
MSDWAQKLEPICRTPGCRLAKGLSRAELEAVQEILGFRWPSDLCQMLSEALPLGADFPFWRALARAGSLGSANPQVQWIKRAMEWPLEGMMFDIHHNGFWDPEWGEKPGDEAEAFAMARAAVAAAPPLVPIFRHRYLPAVPCEPGNPVLSVYQMDIIVYGANLTQYLENEFAGGNDVSGVAREIPRWTRWMEIGR